MANWTNIQTDRLEPGKPIRSIDGIALRDNPIAIAEGAAGAPRPNYYEFITSSKTFVAPKGGNYLVTVVSGGNRGSNGPNATSGNNNPFGGAGGGRGGMVIGVISLDRGQSVSAIVGGSGANSSFGGIIASPLSNGTRGGGGEGSPSNGQGLFQAGGKAGSRGSVSGDRGNGAEGGRGYGAGGGGGGAGVVVGSGYGGNGGAGGYFSASVTASAGAGGGQSTTGAAGGNGAPGCILIQW